MEVRILAALALGGVLLAAVLITVIAALLYSRRTGTYEYARPDFGRRAGFRARSLPESDIVRLERIFLLGGAVAQLEYNVEPQWKLILRVGRAGADLREEDFEQIFREQVTLYHRDTRVNISQNEGGAAMLRWTKNGFDYLLVLPDSEMGLRGGMMPLFVQGTEMVESKTA
ncbi:hypothetical protein [Candidatus Allofournierella merdipullorum]|uniref:hypothetical protein n=1 Tax=Candidatus Allofournierella merdipullorum TaxID=2838595 RepID=UPI00374F3F02